MPRVIYEEKEGSSEVITAMASKVNTIIVKIYYDPEHDVMYKVLGSEDVEDLGLHEICF